MPNNPDIKTKNGNIFFFLYRGIVSAGIVIPFISIVSVVLICLRRNIKPGGDITEAQPGKCPLHSAVN